MMGLMNGGETKWPHCSGLHVTIVEDKVERDEDNMENRKDAELLNFFLVGYNI